MREMLYNTKNGIGDKPHLYLTECCRAGIEYIPDAPIDDKKPEDIDEKWKNDHILDALRYGVMREHHETKMVAVGF